MHYYFNSSYHVSNLLFDGLNPGLSRGLTSQIRAWPSLLHRRRGDQIRFCGVRAEHRLRQDLHRLRGNANEATEKLWIRIWRNAKAARKISGLIIFKSRINRLKLLHVNFSCIGQSCATKRLLHPGCPRPLLQRQERPELLLVFHKGPLQ